MILGALALSPTRTYAPVIKEFLYQVPRSHIGAIIHCSGGGQTKCLKFADGVHIVKDNMFPVPPLFTLIQEESGETWKNMYKTFNMGHRMEVYCASDAAAARLIHISKEEYGIDAQIIGRTEPSEETTLTIRSQYGEFEYKKEDL